MALPKLTTTGTTTELTTSTSKSVTTKDGTTSTSDVAVTKSMPKYKTSTLSSSSSSSYTTPVMTVPPSSNNPYISRSTSPSGTVFICFGAIALFIMIATFLAYIFNSWRAKKITLDKEVNYDSEYKGYNYVPNTQNAPPVIPLLGSHQREPSDGYTGSSTVSPFRGGSSSQTNIQRPTDMTKMFISPTAEVLNVRNSSMFLDSNMSPLRDSSMMDSQTSLSQYHHSRDNSRVGGATSLLSVPGSQQQSTLREERGRKGRSVIPSMFLDDMLENDDD